MRKLIEAIHMTLNIFYDHTAVIAEEALHEKHEIRMRAFYSINRPTKNT